MRIANEHLSEAIDCAGYGEERLELASEELRRALHALDVLVGRVDVEAVLDEIFLRFCLGK